MQCALNMECSDAVLSLFSQFCDLAEAAIVHKMVHPDLAINV